MGVLTKKRTNSALAVLAASGAGGFGTFAPTPSIELHKQVLIGSADIAMCVGIWKIYFDEEIGEKSVLEMLRNAGFIAVAAGGTGWVIARIGTGVLGEIANWFGPPGWILSGAVAFSGTAALGAAFIVCCDQYYQKRRRDGWRPAQA